MTVTVILQVPKFIRHSTEPLFLFLYLSYPSRFYLMRSRNFRNMAWVPGIMDKESPAQMFYMGLTANGNPSAYSPSMLYTTHVLDAALRTVNALHQENPFDFDIDNK